MPLPTSPPWDYPRACGAYIDSNKDATDEQIETANRIEKELSKTSDGEALLNAYLDIDVKKFDESWAEDDVKYAESSMPSPHNDNPIIVFGGKEFASSMVDRSVARNKLKSDIAAWEMFIDNLPRRKWRKSSKVYKRAIRVMDTPLALTMVGPSAGVYTTRQD